MSIEGNEAYRGITYKEEHIQYPSLLFSLILRSQTTFFYTGSAAGNPKIEGKVVDWAATRRDRNRARIAT